MHFDIFHDTVYNRSLFDSDKSPKKSDRAQLLNGCLVLAHKVRDPKRQHERGVCVFRGPAWSYYRARIDESGFNSSTAGESCSANSKWPVMPEDSSDGVLRIDWLGRAGSPYTICYSQTSTKNS